MYVLVTDFRQQTAELRDSPSLPCLPLWYAFFSLIKFQVGAVQLEWESTEIRHLTSTQMECSSRYYPDFLMLGFLSWSCATSEGIERAIQVSAFCTRL